MGGQKGINQVQSKKQQQFKSVSGSLSASYEDLDMELEEKDLGEQVLKEIKVLEDLRKVRFEDYRNLKEIWMEGLQKQFNQIYNILEGIIFRKNQMDEDGVQGGWSLKEFIEEIEKDIKRVYKLIHQFIHTKEPFAFMGETRQIQVGVQDTLKDLLKLIKQFYDLGSQNLRIDNMESHGKRELRNQIVLQEIKMSTKRVQRIKAGNRLDQVLGEQLVQLKDSQSVKSFKKNFRHLLEPREILKEEKKSGWASPKNSEINSPKSSTYLRNVENKKVESMVRLEMDTLKRNVLRTSQSKYRSLKKPSKITKLDESFNKQVDIFGQRKIQLIQVIQEMDTMNKKNPNFYKKYENLQRYFRVRFNFVTSVIGEDLIGDFIIQNENNQKENGGYAQNKDEFKQEQIIKEHLDLLDFDFGFGETKTEGGNNQNKRESVINSKGNQPHEIDDKQLKVLKQIKQINEQIKFNLMQEEQTKRIQMIEDLSNQQHGKILMEKMEIQGNGGGSFQQNFIFGKSYLEKKRKQQEEKETQKQQQRAIQKVVIQNKLNGNYSKLPNTLTLNNNFNQQQQNPFYPLRSQTPQQVLQPQEFFQVGTPGQNYGSRKILYLNAHPLNQLNLNEDFTGVRKMNAKNLLRNKIKINSNQIIQNFDSQNYNLQNHNNTLSSLNSHRKTQEIIDQPTDYASQDSRKNYLNQRQFSVLSQTQIQSPDNQNNQAKYFSNNNKNQQFYQYQNKNSNTKNQPSNSQNLNSQSNLLNSLQSIEFFNQNNVITNTQKDLEYFSQNINLFNRTNGSNWNIYNN